MQCDVSTLASTMIDCAMRTATAAKREKSNYAARVRYHTIVYSSTIRKEQDLPSTVQPTCVHTRTLPVHAAAAAHPC
jgi:hypothetical protein